MKYGCKDKTDVLLQLNYMVIHAPDDFPPEGGMTLDLAYATVDYGLKQIEEKDGRPAVLSVIERIRSELKVSRQLFDLGQINPACHKLQDVEDILRPIRVKEEVA